MAALLTLILLLLPLLALVRYSLDKLRVTSLLAHIPGPSYPLPLMGNVLTLLGPMDTIMDRGLKLYRQYGPRPMKFWVGETPVVTLFRAEDLEHLLNSQKEVEKPDLVYKPVRGFFGDGLITLNGESWFIHRKALTPVFHFSILERYAGIFTRRAVMLTELLASEVPAGKSFDIMKYHSTFVTETITETAFGMTPGSNFREKRELADFVKATEVAFSIIAKRIVHPWLLIDAIFNLSPSGRRHREVENLVNRMARKVIAEKKLQLQQRAINGEEKVTDEDDGVRKKYTFLDLALSGNSDVLSDDEILQEVRTLIAVQQTSATTLSFIMVLLALHPEVQDAARREVREVDAVEGLHPLERLNRLKYVERVIKESLRLFPVTAFFSRKLKSELRLSDMTLPAGLLCNVFVYAAHRDPHHWPDPERFDPDRFLPDRCTGRHPYAYVPFSAGPRNCIGQRYAMLQMKAVVAGLLAKLRFTPGHGCCADYDKLEVNLDTFLYIRGGFNVRLHPL